MRENSERLFRKARTRSLIQLGGLIEKSGLMETFDLRIGADFQRDLDMKDPITALFGGLLDLKKRTEQNELSTTLLAQEGLKALANEKG